MPGEEARGAGPGRPGHAHRDLRGRTQPLPVRRRREGADGPGIFLGPPSRPLSLDLSIRLGSMAISRSPPAVD